MPINPLFITDFNRIRLEFVGHYRDVCENPASNTLWMDVGRNSSLQMTYQSLALKTISRRSRCRSSIRVIIAR